MQMTLEMTWESGLASDEGRSIQEELGGCRGRAMSEPSAWEQTRARDASWERNWT